FADARAPADDRAAASMLDQLARAMPSSALEQSRALILADASGKVLAVFPPMTQTPATLLEWLGESQPLTTFADRAGVMTIRLADGMEGIATVRALPASSGQIALVQPSPRALDNWRGRALGYLSLLGGTFVALLGL